MIKIKEKSKHQQPHPRRLVRVCQTTATFRSPGRNRSLVLALSLSLFRCFPLPCSQIGNGGFCLFGNLKIGV